MRGDLLDCFTYIFIYTDLGLHLTYKQPRIVLQGLGKNFFRWVFTLCFHLKVKIENLICLLQRLFMYSSRSVYINVYNMIIHIFSDLWTLHFGLLFNHLMLFHSVIDHEVGV